MHKESLNFRSKKGDAVNLEYDIIAKYVEKKYGFKISFQNSENISEWQIIENYNHINTVFHSFQYRNTTSFYNPVILRYRLRLKISVFLIFHPSRHPLKFVQMNNWDIIMNSKLFCKRGFSRSTSTSYINAHSVF